jgi:hypothetical protein
MKMACPHFLAVLLISFAQKFEITFTFSSIKSHWSTKVFDSPRQMQVCMTFTCLNIDRIVTTVDAGEDP